MDVRVLPLFELKSVFLGEAFHKSGLLGFQGIRDFTGFQNLTPYAKCAIVTHEFGMSSGGAKFTFKDIRYINGARMFERAYALFQQGKVRNLTEHPHGYEATVEGTHPYTVTISKQSVDAGECDCYMGQREELCKHLLAVGLAVLAKEGKSTEPQPAPKDLPGVKLLVAAGMRKIRPYDGPSSIWFEYQNKLDMGSDMISDAIQNLPATKENFEYLWSLVKRLSTKLAEDGVDDSNGTVGGCVSDVVRKCVEFVRNNTFLLAFAKRCAEYDSGFGFEDELKTAIEKMKG